MLLLPLAATALLLLHLCRFDLHHWLLGLLYYSLGSERRVTAFFASFKLDVK